MQDLDEDAPKKTPRGTIIRRAIVAALALSCAGVLVYTRWIVAKHPLGGPCSFDIHCEKEAPRCLKPSMDEQGVCSRSCADDGECASSITCVKVELDDYDERGRPLEGGYCFPQALLDARRNKKRNDGGVAVTTASKSDSWIDVPEVPNQLEGEVTIERGTSKTSYEVKGSLLRAAGATHGRTIVDTSTLRVYAVDDDKKTFAASQLGTSGPEGKVTKTDRKDTIAERACEVWLIDDGRTRRETCVVKGASFVDPTARAITQWEKELTVRGVFPLRVSDGDKPRLLVTKLDLHPVDRAGFVVPKAYKNLAAR